MGKDGARVSSRAPAWSYHKISEAEIDQLQQYFFKVLELPGSVLEDSCRWWEGVAVILQSRGRRVSPAGVSKEVRTRLKLDYDPKEFLIGEDHIVLRLSLVGGLHMGEGGRVRVRLPSRSQTDLQDRNLDAPLGASPRVLCAIGDHGCGR